MTIPTTVKSFILTNREKPIDLTIHEYNALKVAFQDLIFDKYNNDEMTMEEIIEEYNDALIGDGSNEWAIFKQYGFNLMTEALALDGGSINYNNSATLDENFRTALKDIYDVYVRPENVDMIEYVNTELTTTAFGLHLIIATPGSDFEQPTAFFEVDSENPDAFSVGSANPDVTPTEAQILLYNEIKFAASGGPFTQELLPTEVYAAIDTYYGTLFDAYFSQTGFSIAAINYMIDNNATFTDASNLGSLESILEVLYTLNFPDEFVIQD